MNIEFKRDGDDVLPEHPGRLMKRWYMARKGLSASDIAAMTAIKADRLHDIIDGKEDIDRPTALELAKVFGSSAETLYRLQDEYDHFKSHNEIKDFDSLPSLKAE